MLPNPQFPADSVIFTEEILNGNFIFYVVKDSKYDIPLTNVSSF